MSTAVVVLIIGMIGLALTALLLIREPDIKIRIATIAGAVLAFLLAWLLAVAFGQGPLEAIATATLGAAVLAFVLIAQWRFFRSLFARHGGKL